MQWLLACTDFAVPRKHLQYLHTQATPRGLCCFKLWRLGAFCRHGRVPCYTLVGFCCQQITDS